MKPKFLVSSSPHIGNYLTTKRIMIHVIIALCIPLVASTVIFGLYSLFIVFLAVVSAVFGEWLFNIATKKNSTIGDFSAVVTGMILGMNLPPSVPFYFPIVGGIFATMLVKMLFGGIGQNFANPAATARIFLTLSWTGQMTKFMAPLTYSNGISDFFAGFTKLYVTTATPLAEIKGTALTGMVDLDLLDLFLGRIGGSIGEVSAIAILLAALYLIVFKIIDWRIPLVYVLTIAILALIFYENGYRYILPSILSGGVLFAGVFMFTDYSTSPHTRLGVCIFAFGGGLITMLIRRFGGFNEGACFSILLMNLLVPFIDRAFKPKPFGYKRVKVEKSEAKNG